jgi:hypothetical protein
MEQAEIFTPRDADEEIRLPANRFFRCFFEIKRKQMAS